MSFHPFRALRLLLAFIVALTSAAAFGATATALVPAAAPHGARLVIAGTGLDAPDISVFFPAATGTDVSAPVASRSADALEIAVPVQAVSGGVRVMASSTTIATFGFTLSPDPAFVKITTLAAD